MAQIRLLTKDEIECRVAQVGKDLSWCSVLLYKDARVDMRMLDEVFGPLNWQRRHEVIDGKLFCTVSVWDDHKGQWVSKQDVGTESNTEAEKGQASDSFKRACFNLGIGRELYTAPNIFINLTPADISNGKVRARFHVEKIAYTEGTITSLVIADNRGAVRYSYPQQHISVEQIYTQIGNAKSLADLTAIFNANKELQGNSEFLSKLTAKRKSIQNDRA